MIVFAWKSKIDFYDAKEKVIHEIKRGDKVENAHEWQAKFYIWLFLLNGIKEANAILEYPRLRQTTRIELTEYDIKALENMVTEIILLKTDSNCPPVIRKPICKNCSYYELCYIDEE
jgi:CRISPR-associated exonuclease Cas4